MTDTQVQFLDRGDGLRLAFRKREGQGPTIVFLPGYASDMEGSKALALDAFASERGLPLLRFDYSGTGSSAGAFEDGTLARWTDDAQLMLDLMSDGPVVLAGSSMGAWIALHLALRKPERVVGLVGIASAPDFTEWGFSERLKARLSSGETLRARVAGRKHASHDQRLLDVRPGDAPARTRRSRSIARYGWFTATATKPSRSTWHSA